MLKTPTYKENATTTRKKVENEIVDNRNRFFDILHEILYVKHRKKCLNKSAIRKWLGKSSELCGDLTDAADHVQ